MQPDPLQLPSAAHATAARKRTAWEVQRSVLFALMLREMKARVGGQWMGAIWTLFEPLAHVLVILAVYVGLRAGSQPGYEVPVFLATGLLPYFLFQHLAIRLMDSIESNRGLFSYRQVKPFDTVLSRAFVELLVNGIVYAFTLALLAWWGMHVVPADPLEVLTVHALLFLLGVGYGMLAAVVSHDRPRTRSFLRLSMMPMYVLSGVIFPVHLAPPEVLQWLLLNPLLHLVEASRHAFGGNFPLAPGVNLLYPLLCALVLCVLALLMYRRDRLRLVTSA